MESSVGLDGLDKGVMESLLKVLEGNGGRSDIRDGYELSKKLHKFDFDPPCSFAKGDWVTPKEGSGLRGCGEPHLVLEVYSNTRFELGGRGDPLSVYNMVVACVSPHDDVLVYAVSSDRFEKYTGIVYGEYNESV